MKNIDIIGLMVQETISIEHEDQRMGMLPYEPDNYFEIYASLDPERLCYIIHYKNSVVEIPQNWGPFNNRISSEFYLSRFDDTCGFVRVMEDFFQKEIETVKIILEKPSMELPLPKAA